MSRLLPYPSFAFLVVIEGVNDADAESPLGGFSDVSGLGTELKIAEYRNGNEKENHVRKVACMHTVSDVTLKRGIVNSSDFWEWIDEARREPETAQRKVTITLRAENGDNVQSWELQNCVPMKYTGPTLDAKGGGDIAIEEIVLSPEGFKIVA